MSLPVAFWGILGIIPDNESYPILGFHSISGNVLIILIIVNG
jgi:hypothetical protein